MDNMAIGSTTTNEENFVIRDKSLCTSRHQYPLWFIIHLYMVMGFVILKTSDMLKRTQSIPKVVEVNFLFVLAVPTLKKSSWDTGIATVPFW